jgi:hypothetical protein
MTPGTLNLTVRQGDTFSQVLTIFNTDSSDPTGRTPGTPIDLTGCVAEMRIAAAYNVAPAYSLSSATATPNGGSIVLGAAAGTVTISIPPADTLALNNGRYDLKIKFPDGSIMTFVAGSVFVETEVTVWTQ